MASGTSQELLQAANDRTFSLLWGIGAEEGDFVCECGQRDCTDRLELTIIEYAAREDGHWILAPGHEQVESGPSPLGLR